LQPRDAQHGDQLVAEARREVSDAEEAHRRHTTELEAAKAS
jgi:ribonuclease BN (tRNA processing enzyme)